MTDRGASLGEQCGERPSLAPLYKKLLALYDLRLDADYRALSISSEKAQEGVNTVAEVFQVVTQHTALERNST